MISDAEIAGIMGWRGPGAYTAKTLRNIRLVIEKALSPAPADPDQYYLQDSRDYVGNDLMFWGIEGRGYVTDVSKAQVYTKAEAARQHQVRDTDIPWPKAYIDAHTRPAVDMQYVKRDVALTDTGIMIITPKRYRPKPVNCCGCGRILSTVQQYCGPCPNCGADNCP